jgi:hypothetical protein
MVCPEERDVTTHAPTAAADPAAPTWDQPQADAALAAVEALADRTAKQVTADARRRLVEVYRHLARRYHAGRDQLLLQVEVALRSRLAEWREQDRRGTR